MVLRLNQVAAEFRKVSNKQMAETTKRTIRENVSINAQLAKMSDKTMELIQENDELRTKEKKMKLQIDMLEHNEKELAKKNSSNQKVNNTQTGKYYVIFSFQGFLYMFHLSECRTVNAQLTSRIVSLCKQVKTTQWVLNP